MHSIVQFLRRNPRARKVTIPAYRMVARLNVFSPPPRVLANSMPKAGTHLLASLLANLPQMRYSGKHFPISHFTDYELPGELSEPDWRDLAATLRTVNDGQFMTSHFPAVPGISQMLAELDFVHLFIMRDPRDIVVSHAHYVSTMPTHPLHRFYTEALSSADERLMASIKGFSASDFGPAFESIGQRLAIYLPWLDDPHAVVVRFDDLIGTAGGGSAERQCEAVRDVAARVGRPLAEDQVLAVAARVWSPKSSTFRSGRTGDWRRHFTDEHKRAFKDEAANALARLRYAIDNDW